MKTRSRLLAAGLATALALAAAGAGADDTGPAAEVELPQAEEPAADAPIEQASSGTQPTGAAALEDWRSRRPWRYGTQNLYPLTRGMADAGIPAPARWPLYPFTALFDTGNLLFSAIGGLYGD